MTTHNYTYSFKNLLETDENVKIFIAHNVIISLGFIGITGMVMFMMKVI